jgi:hypothetical protein
MGLVRDEAKVFAHGQNSFAFRLTSVPGTRGLLSGC